MLRIFNVSRNFNRLRIDGRDTIRRNWMAILSARTHEDRNREKIKYLYYNNILSHVLLHYSGRTAWVIGIIC